MQIFAHKNYKCGLFFPIRAGYAKPEINLPWPHSHPYLTQLIHVSYDSQERLKRSKAFFVSSSLCTPTDGKMTDP